MRVKLYKMRSLAVENGKNTLVDLHLEFEGKRAFAIWESFSVGEFELQARVEIDPKLLQKVGGKGWDFFYQGEIALPRPQDN
jgi:hypothetical protein